MTDVHVTCLACIVNPQKQMPTEYKVLQCQLKSDKNRSQIQADICIFICWHIKHGQTNYCWGVESHNALFFEMWPAGIGKHIY